MNVCILGATWTKKNNTITFYQNNNGSISYFMIASITNSSDVLHQCSRENRMRTQPQLNTINNKTIYFIYTFMEYCSTTMYTHSFFLFFAKHTHTYTHRYLKCKHLDKFKLNDKFYTSYSFIVAFLCVSILFLEIGSLEWKVRDWRLFVSSFQRYIYSYTHTLAPVYLLFGFSIKRSKLKWIFHGRKQTRTFSIFSRKKVWLQKS